MNKLPRIMVLLGITIAITSLFIVTLEHNIFATEYSNYINNYGIEADYSVHPSNEQRYMIIPVGAEFKDSNQQKIGICAQNYHNMIPKIYRDDESYWEGSNVACAYGLYNYNVNVGNKNLDPILRIQIEGEAELCMLDDHCMKKINNIFKGKIALPPAIQ